MSKKGDIIFWNVENLEIEASTLEGLGLGAFVPRNDFKAALIKALRFCFKGNDRLYRRFNDKGREVSFGIFIESKSDQSIDITKEFQFKLNKDSGLIGLISSGKKPPIVDEIIERYNHEKIHLDSTQFTATIRRYINEAGWAVSLKKHGGLYFIDERFSEAKDNLKKIFGQIPGATLGVLQVGKDDKEAASTIENAVSEDIFDELQSLVAEIDEEFKTGVITKRRLEGKKERAEHILEKIGVHEVNLRTKAKALRLKANSLARALAGVTSKIEDNLVDAKDFVAALGAL